VFWCKPKPQTPRRDY